MISTEAFVDDFSKVLIPIAIRGSESIVLTNLVLDLINETDSNMTARSIENLMFFIDRCIQTHNEAQFKKVQKALVILFDFIDNQGLIGEHGDQD